MTYEQMFIKNKNQIILLAANILLVFFLILLSNLNILPLRLGDFIFFSIIALAFALYRPGWSFLFFVGTIALENINLAPVELGISIRPYQFFAGVTISAIAIRFATKRLNFNLVKLLWYDFAMIILGAASFVSAIFAENKGVSLKQSVILATFILIYFLVRNYIQTKDDIRRILPFFLSSSVIVMLYGIWQNVRFLQNLSHFEVMPGRPNATFTEADWYGIFLSLLLAVAYALIFYFKDNKNKLLKTGLFLFLLLIFINLILTVSRSAWLGAFAATFIYLFVVFTGLSFRIKDWQWKETFKNKVFIFSALILSIAIVYLFSLTNFQLGNRIQSTGSGLQKITVSCAENATLPDTISSTDELEKFGCKHINLEEIEKEKSAGKFVTEIYRNDPNVSIRGEIYKKSWNIIKANPVFGIGWGNISSHLGTDERGTGLNASNIFLEVWLGSGIIGLLAFSAIYLYILFQGIRFFFKQDKTIGIFLMLGFFALLIPNLFNSGIFLGILWMFLATHIEDGGN